MEYINLIFNLIVSSGLISLLIFYRSKQRKEAAGATIIEAESIKAFATEWKELADSRDIKLEQKDSKIDSMYIMINEWRDKYNSLSNECHTLKLENQSLKFRLCNKRGCEGREPQTGF